MKHILSVLVENKPGVLSRVTGLISRRGFNIESLCVCATEDKHLSRMTIVLNGDEYILSQMTKQLDKLIDVKKIALAEEADSIYRELLLMKVSAPAEKRSEIIEIKEIYKAKIVDLSPETHIPDCTWRSRASRASWTRSSRSSNRTASWSLRARARSPWRAAKNA